MRQRSVWILIACVLALYLSAAALFTPPSDTAPLPAGTSYSHQSSGASALFSLFHGSPAAGSLRLLTEPQLGLPGRTTAVIVEPQTDDTAAMAKAWIQFVRSGGHVIALLNQSSALATSLGLRITPAPATNGALRLTQLTAQNSQRAVTTFRVSSFGRYATVAGNLHGGEPWLLTLPGGARATVGVTERVGKGSITLLGLPGLAYNGSIAKSDNLGVLLSLLQPTKTRIAFVETVHGYSIEPGPTAVFGAGINAAFALLCSAVVIWLWGESRRFGRPLAPLQPARPASLQLAMAMADHYRRTGSFNSLLAQLKRLAKARGASLSLPQHAKEPRQKTFLAECNVLISALRGRQNVTPSRQRARSVSADKPRSASPDRPHST